MMNRVMKLIQNDKFINVLQWILFIGSAVFLFLALYETPYHSDDMVYMNQWESKEALTSIGDIVYFQIQHYLNWGGRTVAHTIAQLLFLMGPLFSSLLTTIVYFLTAYLIVWNVLGKADKVIFFLVAGAMFYLNPVFDETVLWVTGTANYLYTSLLVLLAVLPVSAYFRKQTFSGKYWILLPVIFFAGWCNENTSPFVFLLYAALFFPAWKQKRKEWLFYGSSALLSGAGNALLLLAPGNGLRTDTYSGGIMGLMYRGHGQVNAWCLWLFPIVMILLVLFYVCRHKTARISWVYLLVGIGSTLIMIVSPSFPSRAAMGPFVFFLLPFASLIFEVKKENALFINWLSVFVLLGFTGCMASTSILQFARNIGYEIPG